MTDAYCFDCGLSYGSDGWADFLVSDETWEEIAPVDGHGLLCVTCMVRRCNRLGIDRVVGRFTSGPFCVLPG